MQTGPDSLGNSLCGESLDRADTTRAPVRGCVSVMFRRDSQLIRVWFESGPARVRYSVNRLQRRSTGWSQKS